MLTHNFAGLYAVGAIAAGQAAAASQRWCFLATQVEDQHFIVLGRCCHQLATLCVRHVVFVGRMEARSHTTITDTRVCRRALQKSPPRQRAYYYLSACRRQYPVRKLHWDLGRSCSCPSCRPYAPSTGNQVPTAGHSTAPIQCIAFLSTITTQLPVLMACAAT